MGRAAGLAVTAPRRLPLTAILVVADLLAVSTSFTLAFLARRSAPFLSPLAHGFEVYFQVWPVILLWPLFFWRERLYPGLWMSAREELRRTVAANTLAGLVVMAATFLSRSGPDYSRPIVVGGWLACLVLVPAARTAVRRLAAHWGTTGPAAVVLGAANTARIVLDGLRRQHPPALRPVALFDDDSQKVGTFINGVPVVGPISQAAGWAREHGIRTALFAMPGISRQRLVEILEEQGKAFPTMVIVPDLFGLSIAESRTLEIQGVLALELRKNLLYRHNLVVKRLLDLALILLFLLFLLPLAAGIAMAIWIESRRPVFYGHPRVGKEGKSFMAWKFRTMVADSDRVLENHLSRDPGLRQEWVATRKLRSDPRLTVVGRALRRLSLDELPQLWNVARGEMSLVGPRPIVEEEIAKYGDRFDLYTQVFPGLTGLWQVSGRSDLSYADRVWLDTHYVRNWSIWMDLVILVRTVWVVLSGAGAY